MLRLQCCGRLGQCCGYSVVLTVLWLQCCGYSGAEMWSGRCSHCIAMVLVRASNVTYLLLLFAADIVINNAG